MIVLFLDNNYVRIRNRNPVRFFHLWERWTVQLSTVASGLYLTLTPTFYDMARASIDWGLRVGVQENLDSRLHLNWINFMALLRPLLRIRRKKNPLQALRHSLRHASLLLFMFLTSFRLSPPSSLSFFVEALPLILTLYTLYLIFAYLTLGLISMAVCLDFAYSDLKMLRL